MLRLASSRRTPRRGNILIVTLALLALMAVVGITAVYYTKDQAERARIQGQPKGGGEGFSPDGSSAALAFLNGFIYDVSDSGQGLLNSTRGHSLMATMYGRTGPGNPTPYHAWTGPGTFGGATSATFSNIDSRQLVNFRLFPSMGSVVRDPEHSNERTLPAAAQATDFFGKNAAYTYPDIKDFYLASICPSTGEILVPSFHRDHAGGFGTLASSNPNWTNAQGKFLTLRPRPQDHGPNQFPPVPPNADGSITGDVQNLPGGFGPNGVARNDSLWMDIGLPPITLPNGTRVKPLVAPLILDLDGRVNLAAHGNVMGTGGIQSSGQGLGSWEVSLEQALGAEGRAIVNTRGLPQRRGGVAPSASQNAFAAARYSALAELPLYSSVAWSGFTAANPLQLPGTNPATDLFRTSPTYTGGYTNINDSTSTMLPVNHPSLYNPSEWPPTGSPHAFPINDTRALIERYAPYPFTINKLSFASSVTTSLIGTRPIANPNPPQAGTQNQYRTDPSHPNRHITTTHSYSLDRVGWMPGTGLASDPNSVFDSIDLNRSLADYRLDASTPLTPGNAGNQVLADQERLQFATDIFVRLVAVTANPAVATVNPTTGVVTVVDTTQSRNLAQLAVNIVDFIDNDDVNTRFPWNTANPADVVYGVEKPRLVINEAYSEVNNDPTDPAFTDPKKAVKSGAAPHDDAHVRFWVELQNPSVTPYTSATANPLGDGSAKVKYTAAELGSVAAFNPYQLQIVRNNKAGTPVINGLRLTSDASYRSNVTGDILGTTADITFDFSKATAGAQSSIVPLNGNPNASAGMLMLAADVPPAPGTPTVMGWSDYNPAATGNQIKGDPVGTAGSTSMAYKVKLATLAMPDTDVPNTLGRHVILLRRLANPYIPGPTANNPYITVDILDHVRAADRILLANDKDMNEVRTARMAVGGAGYEPAATGSEAFWPQSVGKVQPYTSYADTTVATAAGLTYPTNSMVLRQDPTTTGADGVKQTFGRQNSKSTTAPTGVTAVPASETLVAPYDWLVHMDRPLVNQLELLHITVGKQHDLTTFFVGPGGTKDSGSAQAAMLTNPTYASLYRALGVLRVQPYGQHTAFGGRVPGRININTIQDIRVWRALFDAQGYNGFTTTDVDAWWTALMTTRTQNMQSRTDAVAPTAGTNSCPVPGMSVHDGAGGTDRPFLPFNAPTATAGVTYASGVGVADTLLRFNPAIVTTQPTTPLNWPYLSVQAATHPYQKLEAYRKILNNTTTVSHTFAVWVTVGYFEVTGPDTPSGVAGVPAHVSLGKEFFLQAPGDTRKKFFGIVDRSNVGLDLTSFQPYDAWVKNPVGAAPPLPTHATVRPFFTTLEWNTQVGATTIQIATSSSSGSVAADGTLVTITPSATPTVGSQLAIGSGANLEIVNVTAIAPSAGTATMTVTATTKPHYAGECVSNVVPGNPGPQTGFDPNLDTYKSVVPLWTKLP